MIQSDDQRLTAYVLGELDEADRAEIERAIEQSAELREEVEAIRQTTALLSDGLQSEPSAPLTAEQHAEIHEQAAESNVSLADRPTELKQRTGWRRYAMAITASITLASLLCVLAIFNSDEAPGTHPRSTVSLTTSEELSELGQDDVHESFGDGRDSDRLNYRALPSGLMESINGGAAEMRVVNDDSGSMFADSFSDGDAAESSGSEIQMNQALLDSRRRGGEMHLSASAPEMEAADGPSVAMGLDRDGKPTADFSFSINDNVSGQVPAFGGFNSGGAGGIGGGGMGGAARTPGLRQGLGEGGGAGGAPAGAARSQFSGAGAAGVDGLASDLNTARVANSSQPSPSPTAADPFSAAEENRAAAPERQRIRGRVEGVTANSLDPLGESDDDPAATPSRAKALTGPASGEGEEEALGLGGQVGGDKAEAAKTRIRTWRRAQATPNASRLVIGDRDELLLEGMQANVLVDGFRARVLLDLYYFNNRGRQLEGNFKLRLPNEASLYYFAFGQSVFEYRPQVDHLTAKGFLNGELVRASGLNPKGILEAREGSWSHVKEARVVPREKAAHAYSETVRRRVDPALVEWSGAGVFNARVFPLMPNKLHRIVVAYDVNLQKVGDDLVYQLDLPEDVSQCMVDLNVSALPGTTAEIEPETRPFTSSGRAYYHIDEISDRHIELRFKTNGPSMLVGSDAEAGEFFTTRVTPELPASEVEVGRERAVFLVDTSLSSRPDKFNVWLDLLEASLTKNRDSMKQFGVLFFNIESHWWKDSFVDNTEENVNELLMYCRSLSLEGATDLRQALTEAASPNWAKNEEKPRTHDLFLLSDGAVTWGEMNVHRLSDVLAEREASLFAYKSGMTGTATGVLEHLARETGGAVFSVVNEEEVASAATAHRRRPWKLLDVTVPGGSDLLVAGRPQFIYPGQPLLIVGRGEPDAEVMIHVRRGDEEKHVSIKMDQKIESELASRTYGQVAVGQLEDLGSSLQDVSVAYARHFRITGQTCSLLMLDSEADYQRFNIKAEDDVFVVKSTPSADLVTKKLDELAEQLGDAKAAVVAWLGKLENTAGFEFKVPTALRLVIDRLPQEAFDVTPQKLVTKSRERGDAPKAFVQQLDRGKLDYTTVTTQATQRFEKHGAADGLRTLSSLVEQNPGDPVLTRDVAFSAIEWGLGGQAYPLLKRTASMRPYEPQSYQAMAECLAEIGHADLAMIYYEVALNARWHERYKDVHQIAGVEYLRLLRQINDGQLSSHASEYAKARAESLVGKTPIQTADLVITMMWNTDRTDVDLHVVEPTGEECYYDHPQTRIGGRVTRDVTEGFGPEMYTLPSAKHGNYKIMANYFGTDANRTNVRSKVYITVYENFGGKRERISKKTITLSNQKEKRELATVMVEK